MKVVKHKYEIDGKLFDDLTGLQDLKEGTKITPVLVVEESKEDKSGDKLGEEKEEEKEEEQPKVGLTPDEEAELKK